MAQVHAETVKTSYLIIQEQPPVLYLHVECNGYDPIRNDPRGFGFPLDVAKSANVPGWKTFYFTNGFGKTYSISEEQLRNALTAQQLARAIGAGLHQQFPRNPVIDEVMGNSYCSGK